ncbi:hypothetical protein [Rossellomorea aquimaris]|uniref:hypothetical protein n=1 Tax=Rossellomorea aquimaris TaxID=189382 RepID=UPI0007D09B83|nr:hypothetical protein [Rossellomorea aquimaris]
MKKNKKEKEDKINSVSNSGLGAAATEVVYRYGSAATEYILGYQGDVRPDGQAVKGLKDIAKSRVTSYANKKQQAGFAGEVLHESRTNAENIIKKNSNRIRRTDSLGDTNHQQFDHVKTDLNGNPIINQHGHYTGTSQMKLRGHYDLDEYIKLKKKIDPYWKPPKDLTQDKLVKISAEGNVKQLFNKDYSKYKNVELLHIPAEQYEYAKGFLKEQQINLKHQIKVLEKKGDTQTLLAKKEELERINSVDRRIRKSVSSKDSMNARLRPKLQTAKEMHSVSHRAGVEQAKTGAIIGGAISISKNIVEIIRTEEKDYQKVSVSVIKDTAGAAALSYVSGYSGAAIKALMARSGKEVFKNLSKSNLPAMIATSSFEVGKSIKRYLTEEDFDELQLIEELGEKGTGMMAASMGAAIGTAITPGIGTVVGGMVGYMTSTTIYQSAIDLLMEGRLSEKNRMVVEQLSKEAIQSIQEQRLELSNLIEKHFTERQEVFNRCFSSIQDSLIKGEHVQFSENIIELATTFGIELHFTHFNEFDAFMSEDTSLFKF